MSTSTSQRSRLASPTSTFSPDSVSHLRFYSREPHPLPFGDPVPEIGSALKVCPKASNFSKGRTVMDSRTNFVGDCVYSDDAITSVFLLRSPANFQILEDRGWESMEVMLVWW